MEFLETKHPLRLFRPRLWKGKPEHNGRALAAYDPPPTNAVAVDPWNGETSPITSVTARILFCSPADADRFAPLIKAMDPNARAFDGNGIVCPTVDYGSDGRRIACFEGTVDINGATYQYEAAIGILVAAFYWGPGWNGGHQSPYVKLVCDSIDTTDAQVDWSH